jgi:hypothetical protein
MQSWQITFRLHDNDLESLLPKSIADEKQNIRVTLILAERHKYVLRTHGSVDGRMWCFLYAGSDEEQKTMTCWKFTRRFV